jgi:selenocysteine-specific elongation factor
LFLFSTLAKNSLFIRSQNKQGASIIDVAFIVIDVTKGIQTQTAECLVVAEITTPHIVLILNKIDLIPAEKRTETIARMTQRMQKALEGTRFGGTIKVIPFAAKPQQQDGSPAAPIGVQDIKDFLLNEAPRPARAHKKDPLLFAVDHCFTVKGKGTVATGTVLRGQITPGMTVEIPQLRIEKKIKSMEMFHKPVQIAEQGDRVGLLIPGLASDTMERGLICSPKSVPFSSCLVTTFHPIRYFKQPVRSGSKLHLIIGHTSVMATITLFQRQKQDQPWTFGEPCLFVQEFASASKSASVPTANNDAKSLEILAILQLEHSVPIPPGALIIGSKLDSELTANSCRLAFSSSVVHLLPDSLSPEATLEQLSQLRIYKVKHKVGEIDRVRH